MARFQYPKERLYYDKVQRGWGPKHTNWTRATFGEQPKTASYDQLIARQRHGYRGLGDYAKAARGMLRFGRSAASAFRAGRSSWRGSGDYTNENIADVAEPNPVSTYGPAVDNQLISGGNAPLSVNATSDLTGDIVFQHTEFISNVVATTTAFENHAFAINPGLTASFPFLSQIAKNFTLYDFEGLIFEYRPTSGEFGSTSNALGKVIMATDYDPDAIVFRNSKNMENYDYATATKPSLTARHGVETAAKQAALKMNYVRTGTVSRDKIFTDIGLFQIATEGLPNTGIVGELWVTYNVKLSRSQINTDGQPTAVYKITAPTAVAPFNGAVAKYDNIGITFSTAENSIIFPRALKGKTVMVTFSETSTSAATEEMQITTVSASGQWRSIFGDNVPWWKTWNSLSGLWTWQGCMVLNGTDEFDTLTFFTAIFPSINVNVILTITELAEDVSEIIW